MRMGILPFRARQSRILWLRPYVSNLTRPDGVCKQPCEPSTNVSDTFCCNRRRHGRLNMLSSFLSRCSRQRSTRYDQHNLHWCSFLLLLIRASSVEWHTKVRTYISNIIYAWMKIWYPTQIDTTASDKGAKEKPKYW